MLSNESIRKLSEIKLIEFADAYHIIESNPSNTLLSFDEKMDMMIDLIYQDKYNKEIVNLKKRAKLRFTEADLRDVHYTEDRCLTKDLMSTLSTCNYISFNTNIVLHGPCGTGKTWLSCALGNEAIKNKMKVLYVRMPALIESYNESRNMGKSLTSLVKKYSRYDLLIIDEWLMYNLDIKSQQFIAELMEVRYDKTSTMFCTQYPVKDWYTKLGETTLTEALLDRIVHNMIEVNMGTNNFREKR